MGGAEGPGRHCAWANGDANFNWIPELDASDEEGEDDHANDSKESMVGSPPGAGEDRRVRPALRDQQQQGGLTESKLRLTKVDRRSGRLRESRSCTCDTRACAKGVDQVVKLASIARASGDVFVPSAAPPEGAAELPTTTLPPRAMGPATPFDLDEIERPTYLPEVLSRACRKFEYFFELGPGTSYQEWIDERYLGVTGWADC